MRGFMTAHGQPDQPRSARYILKDYVSGKLLYCHPPPGRDPMTFQHQHQRLLENKANGGEIKMQLSGNKRANQIENVVDKTFFHRVFTGAYLAAIDLVSFVSILFPVCGSKFKSNSGRSSQERKKRQRLRASVFALALPLSLGPGWALWTTVPKASGPIRGPQRRLLGSLLQDNTEIFGYLLGSIAAFGSWASRIPPLSRICRGKTFPSIHLWTRLLSALAGLLYASAIVAHDRRPEYLLRATPWFLTSLGRAALDLANSDWMPLIALPHCKPLKRMAAISRYMELTIEPVQQAGCSATRLPGDGQTSAGVASLQEPPSYPPVQVIRARVSSSSSSQASSINSDLEIRLYSDYLLGARNEFIKQTADMFGSP
ncbi:transmembrane protein 44 isoform b [Camelus ferus]|nr:transmembrane protein 44 isoform b [Camelus ferus]